MDIGNTSGLAGLINTGLNNLSSMESQLKADMAAVSSLSSEDQTAAMLNLQFQMGQYNTMVELTSSITKSLSDSIKSISQKV